MSDGVWVEIKMPADAARKLYRLALATAEESAVEYGDARGAAVPPEAAPGVQEPADTPNPDYTVSVETRVAVFIRSDVAPFDEDALVEALSRILNVAQEHIEIQFIPDEH